MFSAGGGRIGNYDSCCWQTEGLGQFRPLGGSTPYLGQTGKLERVKEWKIEMVCARDHLQPVIQAMREAHPYETPAFLLLETLSHQ